MHVLRLAPQPAHHHVGAAHRVTAGLGSGAKASLRGRRLSMAEVSLSRNSRSAWVSGRRSPRGLTRVQAASWNCQRPAAAPADAGCARLRLGVAASRRRRAAHQGLQRGGDLGRRDVGLEADVGAAVQPGCGFWRIEGGDGDDARRGVHGAQAGDGHAQIGQLRFHDKQRRAAGLEQAEQAVGIFAAAGRGPFRPVRRCARADRRREKRRSGLVGHS